MNTGKNTAIVDLEAGKPYEIGLKTYDFHGDAKCDLLWDIPGRNLEAAALKAAKKPTRSLCSWDFHPGWKGKR